MDDNHNQTMIYALCLILCSYTKAAISTDLGSAHFDRLAIQEGTTPFTTCIKLLCDGVIDHTHHRLLLITNNQSLPTINNSVYSPVE